MVLFSYQIWMVSYIPRFYRIQNRIWIERKKLKYIKIGYIHLIYILKSNANINIRISNILSEY
jgi:hypothetical protein